MRKVTGIILFMLVFLGLVGCSEKAQEIDVKDYVSINVSGYSGEGTEEINFDKEAFQEALLGKYGYTSEEYMKKLSSADTKEKELKKLVGIRNVVDSVDFITIEYGMYENGDTVKYTLVYDNAAAEEISLTINDSSEPYVVNGLEEYEVLTEEDLKKDVTVEITGVAPNLNVQASYNGELPGAWANYVPEKSKIEDGGFAAVEVELNPDELKYLGYTSEQSKFTLEFPVEINERYASKPEEIGEELWGKIYKELKDKYVSRYYMGANRSLYNKGNTTGGMKIATSLGEPAVKEAYILYSKTGNSRIVNQVVVIFETNYKGKASYFGDETIDANFFVGAYVSNIVVDKEGKTEGMLLEAEVTNGEFDYVTLKNSVVTKHMGDYNVVEVPVENFK